MTLHADEADETLARSFEALANPVRLALLRELREPRVLGEMRVAPASSEAPSLARQSVRRHLDRLLEERLVVARETERGFGPTQEYLLHHAALFALAEELAGLARMRPMDEPDVRTTEGPPGGRALPSGPCLVLVHGADLGRVFPLRDGARWVVGRRREAAVCLDYDPYLSGENAAVERTPEGLFLVDMPQSRNGTSLNFQPLPRGGRAPLRHGDLVGVGRSLLLLRET